MNTKLIMSLSAVFLALVGIALSFLAGEIASYAGKEPSRIFVLILQIMGALYFSFGMLNWMAKGSIIGGIYNRSIAIANFTHFVMGTLVLLKALDSALPWWLWALAGFYSIFAVLFAFLLFRHPANHKRKEG